MQKPLSLSALKEGYELNCYGQCLAQEQAFDPGTLHAIGMRKWLKLM